jgi:hemolysin-activating ACP:hemolysin acyltransferase
MSMKKSNEELALELLEPMASPEVLSAAKRATQSGEYIWVQDINGPFGLVRQSDQHAAVIVVYPAWTVVGSDKADFEVDEEWLEG